jgi:cytidylate kinase
MTSPLPSDESLPAPAPTDLPPLHGFQGDRGPTPASQLMPPGLVVAVSREAGARGATIARRVGKQLGWQVYDQELLDYISREGPYQDEATMPLPPAAARWAVDGATRCVATGRCSAEPAVVDLVRAVYGIAAGGNVVILGRGAGWLLPRASTLHVRVVAPIADRIAFLSQWLRLPLEDAAERLRLYDSRRRAFLEACFHAQTDNSHTYDLVLNSSFLGEDGCVELIARAAAVKQAARK